MIKKPSPDARTVVPGHAVTYHDGTRPKKIDELIAKSSVGIALADIKKRGLDAHLVDLERELHPRRRAKKPVTLAQTDAAFMRGFGVALASIWRCQHDGQLVVQLLTQNCFTLEEFRCVGLLATDYKAICQAVRSRT